MENIIKYLLDNNNINNEDENKKIDEELLSNKSFDDETIPDEDFNNAIIKKDQN